MADVRRCHTPQGHRMPLGRVRLVSPSPASLGDLGALIVGRAAEETKRERNHDCVVWANAFTHQTRETKGKLAETLDALI